MDTLITSKGKIMYSLKPANKEDYKFCYNLCKSSMLPLFTKYWGGWKPSSFRSEFVIENTTIIIIADKRAGWYSIQDNEDHLFIKDLYISNRYRNKGIGSKILHKIISESSYNKIMLTTFIDNPAYRLYKRYGFTLVSNNDGVIKMKYEKAHNIPNK